MSRELNNIVIEFIHGSIIKGNKLCLTPDFIFSNTISPGLNKDFNALPNEWIK
ncbi:hypothetical protein [Macrococcus animalis]|uniref:hypothetical protein n=1 Tax=Macrococcus animalis TaxID=3395467 RepID=UPI0039BE8B52